MAHHLIPPSRRSWTQGAVLAWFLAGAPAIQAQTVAPPRPLATRAELESAVAELERTGAGAAEVERIRTRLVEGDFKTGDEIRLSVLGEEKLAGTFAVRGEQMLELPGLPPIGLRGVLRSELREHLTRELSRYLKNPELDVSDTNLRVVISGGVTRPGFYSVPADRPIGDTFMAAGGPVAGARVTKITIRRNGVEIAGEAAVQRAIGAGLTLDQMNLQSGDELVLPERRNGSGALLTVLQVVGGLGVAVLTFTQIF